LECSDESSRSTGTKNGAAIQANQCKEICNRFQINFKNCVKKALQYFVILLNDFAPKLAKSTFRPPRNIYEKNQN